MRINNAIKKIALQKNEKSIENEAKLRFSTNLIENLKKYTASNDKYSKDSEKRFDEFRQQRKIDVL